MDTDEKNVKAGFPHIVEAKSDYLYDALNRFEMLSRLFGAISESGDELHLSNNACSGIAENLATASQKIVDSY